MESYLKDLVKTMYGKSLKDANVKELYNALGKLVVNKVEDDWQKTN